MAGEIMPEIDHKLCILCGDCIASCPTGALSLSEEAVLLDEQQCAYCGDCEDVCPQGAIMLPFEIVLPDISQPEGER
jgi:ferredoxin